MSTVELLTTDPSTIPDYPYGVEKRGHDKAEQTGFDVIESPEHYCAGRKLEPRHVQDDWQLPAYLFCVLKYLARYDRKGAPLEDLRKARRFLDMQIEYMERQNGGG